MRELGVEPFFPQLRLLRNAPTPHVTVLMTDASVEAADKAIPTHSSHRPVSLVARRGPARRENPLPFQRRPTH